MVVVAFTNHLEQLAAYRDHLGLDRPPVADPDRRLYQAVGAGRGRLRDVWSPGTLANYAGLVRRGRRRRTSNGALPHR
jgi:hypothetical protein